MSEGDAAFWRGKFEEAARRHHALGQQIGFAEHRFWRFENCPAPSCAEARSLLVGQVDAAVAADAAVGEIPAAPGDGVPGPRV